MPAATFGDFLQLAGNSLAGASSEPGPGYARRDSLATVVQQAHHLLREMARLTETVAGGHGAPPHDPVPGGWFRAATSGQEALSRGCDNLLYLTEHLGAPDAGAENALADQLAQAARYLTIGRDLLQTHFVTDADGITRPSSRWAAVITTPPVINAFMNELGGMCRHFAPVISELSATKSPRHDRPPQMRKHLRDTYHCLLGLEMAVLQAAAHSPVHARDQQLLYAIPVNITPGRWAPHNGETRTQLCEEIAVSADRLRTAASEAAGTAHWSPLITADSWQWNASAAAITAHLCGILLKSAGERARQLDAHGALGEQLDDASAAIAGSCRQWRAAAAEWDSVTTDTQGRISPVITDASDLLIRLGRLAFDNPAWTPRSAHRAPPRKPSELAPDNPALLAVIAAAHQAADSLAQLADCEIRAVCAAARGGRLHQSALEVHGWHNAAWGLRPAGPVAIDKLVDAYRATARNSRQAAVVLDALAVATEAPSAYLAAVRAVHVPETYRATLPAPTTLPPDPGTSRDASARRERGQYEKRISRLGIADSHIRQRAALIDEAITVLKKEAEQVLMTRMPVSASGTKPGQMLRRGSDRRAAVTTTAPVNLPDYGLQRGPAPRPLP